MSDVINKNTDVMAESNDGSKEDRLQEQNTAKRFALLAIGLLATLVCWYADINCYNVNVCYGGKVSACNGHYQRVIY